MLQIAHLREHRDEAIERLTVRNFQQPEIVDQILDLDRKRRALQTELDKNLAEANTISKEIGNLFKSGKKEEANALRAKTGSLKEHNKELEQQMNAARDEMQDLLYHVPNLPHPSVPAGNTDADNEVVKTVGDIPQLHENALPHWELASNYKLFDLELGVKVSGAGFPVYTGRGARLQRALINFFLDQAAAQGYEETQPPLVINADSGYGTGQLPDKEGQMYHMQDDDLYLIPTAEVPITNLFRNVILGKNDFPVKRVGYTPCFRREAGSYGAHVRGLNRLHQFDKVEIVQVAHPDNSYQVLEEMVAYVESLLQALELPYRILRLCGGDLGFTSALTYDMEVYSAAQQMWLEVSSISNFETYQANRLKLRYRDENNKTQLAHTLNGSALALPRIVAALLENNQTPEGIVLPEALAAYTGFKTIA